MDGEKPTISPLAKDALKFALESEKPVALKKAGRTPGLTPGGKETAAKKEARAQCLDARLGLFEKVGGTDDNPLLRIAPVGVRLLLESCTPADRTALVATAAEPLKPVVEAALTKLAENELKEIGERQTALAKQAGELRSQLRRMWKDQLAAVERAQTELKEQEDAIRTQMVADKEQEAIEGPKPLKLEPGTVGKSQPQTEEEIDFQRDLCRELALVWEDTPEPDVRAALERVMINAGLEQVGEVDEVLEFDAARHKLTSGNGVLPGQRVKVVEPGWLFRSSRGALLVVKSKVASTSF